MQFGPAFIHSHARRPGRSQPLVERHRPLGKTRSLKLHKLFDSYTPLNTPPLLLFCHRISIVSQGVNFGRLDIEVLKKYKKHYKQHVKVKNQNSKQELVDAIHRHFSGRDFPIPNYNDVLPEFLKTCKRKQKDKD